MKTFKQLLEKSKASASAKKFIKGMTKIKINQLGGRMPGNDFVYYDKPKKQWWLIDVDGDPMGIKNKGTLAELNKFIR